MSRREKAFGRVVTAITNDKYSATQRLAVDAGVITPDQADEFLRLNAAFVWKYYARFLSLAFSGRRHRTLERVQVVGMPHLESARRAGRGIILVSAHIGDFDVAGAWLARAGITPVVVSAPIRPPLREAVFTGIRRRSGVIVRDAGTTSVEILAGDLALGRALLIMADRRPVSEARTYPSRLLGKSVGAPSGMAWLASATGAAVLPAATWRAEDGSIVSYFGAPTAASTLHEAMANLSAAASQVENAITAHPEQ